MKFAFLTFSASLDDFVVLRVKSQKLFSRCKVILEHNLKDLLSKSPFSFNRLTERTENVTLKMFLKMPQILGLVFFLGAYSDVIYATCNAQIPIATPSSDFIVHGDSTVTHTVTGLMWKRCQEGLRGATCSLGNRNSLDWQEALEYAQNHEFAGYSDWRLPNIKELASIIESGCKDPAINEEIFPNMDGIFADYNWTSSPSTTTSALRIRFSFGSIHQDNLNQNNAVRLVRDIPLAAFNINSGLNDAWFNPAIPGQGFFINVFPQLRLVFLAWFTYDTSRPPGSVEAILGEPGHRWVTAIGSYSGDTAELQIEITEGGIFDSGVPSPTQRIDGAITLSFNSCNSGSVAYRMPSIGRQGVVPIERLALDNVPACETLATQTERIQVDGLREENIEATNADFHINQGLNDGWFNPETSGQGFFINVFPNLGRMFLAWFTYDTQRPDSSVNANLGDPGHRWLTAFGPYDGNQANLDIEVTEGGVFDSSQPTPTQYADGTLTVDMHDCENGTVTYDILSADLQGQIPIQRLALDNVPLCESLAAQSGQLE